MSAQQAVSDRSIRAVIESLGVLAPGAVNAGIDTFTQASAISDAASRLEAFLDLMLKWNRVYSLTAITDRAQMVTHHIADSLAVTQTLDSLLASTPSPRILDVGTGPGLPGIPLAIVRPRWALTLVDSSSKKTAFVTQAVAELALPNASVVTGRVEEQRAHPFDVVISRAFSSLADFVSLTRPLLAPGGTWVAMKGVVPRDEMAALPAGVTCEHVVLLTVPGLDAERHLILMKATR